MSDSNEFRPNSLSHLIGQDQVREVISTALDFAFQEQVPFPHSLMLGPPGVGKTALARSRKGENEECLVEAFDSTFQVFYLLYPVANVAKRIAV